MKGRQLVLILSVILAIALPLLGAFVVQWYRHAASTQRESTLDQILTASKADTYVDLSGNIFSLTAYAGKPLVLFSWASWCPSCGDELHTLSRIAVTQEVPVVAINRMETLAVANDYLLSITKPEGLIYAVDRDDISFAQSEGFTTPLLIIFDAEGNERYRFDGDLTEGDMQAAFKIAQEL